MPTYDTIAKFAACHRLMVITKGDLLDQEKKIQRFGLGKDFQRIEIVSFIPITTR